MSGEFVSFLQSIIKGKVAFIGVGNVDRGDDAAGMVLADLLQQNGISDVLEGGLTPEKTMPAVREGQFDTVVFMDAVDAGAEPGSVVLLDSRELVTRYPQVSTHKLSLGMIAQFMTKENGCRVWLIGIQPQTIVLGRTGLSPIIDKTVNMLASQIAELISVQLTVPQEQVCN